MTNIENIYKVICMEHRYVSFLLNSIIFIFLILFTLHLILYLTMNIIRLLLYHANTMSYDKTAFYLRYRLLTFDISLYFYIERYISRVTVYRKDENLLNNYVLFNAIKSNMPISRNELI